jgi:FkbM family methyltransferase
MGFLRNAITATRHPDIALEYARWRIGSVIGRPSLVKGAFGTQLHASSFAELRSTRGFVPNSSEAKMILGLSSNCPLFVDIGANVGVWTLALAAAHPNAHVYCLEPAPDTFNVLRNNIALNRLRNISAAQLAVSDSGGVLTFQVSEQDSIFNRLAPTKETAQDLHRSRFTKSHIIEVKCIRLDDFCREQSIDRIGFLKIDVEGAELGVLKGAEYLLRKRAVDLIWIEVEPENLREMGDSIDDLAAFIKNVGYTFHFLQPDGSPGPPMNIRRQIAPNMMVKPE